jgi:hypothetical protein
VLDPPLDEETLARLPAAYAAVLRLTSRGLDHAAIAARLRVEPEAVAPLIQVANAKLRALRTDQPPA